MEIVDVRSPLQYPTSDQKNLRTLAKHTKKLEQGISKQEWDQAEEEAEKISAIARDYISWRARLGEDFFEQKSFNALSPSGKKEIRDTDHFQTADTLVSLLGKQRRITLIEKLARATRLFLELVAERSFSMRHPIDRETIIKWESSLQRLDSTIPKEQSQIHYDLFICRQAINCSHNDLGFPLHQVLLNLLSQGSGAVDNAKKGLQLTGRFRRFGFVYHLHTSWLAMYCYFEPSNFTSLQSVFNEHRRDPIALFGQVDIYADLILRGPPALQRRAMHALTPLATTHRLGISCERVRQQAIRTLALIPNTFEGKLVEASQRTLLRCVKQETHPVCLNQLSSLGKDPLQPSELQNAINIGPKKRGATSHVEAVVKGLLGRAFFSIFKKLGVQLLKDAADFGDATAQLQLGLHYLQAGEEAISLFKEAADQGDAEACFQLWRCYRNGAGGAKKDKDEALHWLRTASERGYLNAHCQLGSCYANGWGVSKDPEEALRLFKKAVGPKKYLVSDANETDSSTAYCYIKAMENQSNWAQRVLGYSYLTGKGMPKNESMAAGWFLRAASKGDRNALEMLGELYKDGRGVNKSASMAAACYEKAAKGGSTRAMESLIGLLRNGSNPEDLRKANEWRFIYEQAIARALQNQRSAEREESRRYAAERLLL